MKLSRLTFLIGVLSVASAGASWGGDLSPAGVDANPQTPVTLLNHLILNYPADDITIHEQDKIWKTPDGKMVVDEEYAPEVAQLLGALSDSGTPVVYPDYYVNYHIDSNGSPVNLFVWKRVSPKITGIANNTLRFYVPTDLKTLTKLQPALAEIDFHNTVTRIDEKPAEAWSNIVDTRASIWTKENEKKSMLSGAVQRLHSISITLSPPPQD